jgi:hypothetical protein
MARSLAVSNEPGRLPLACSDQSAIIVTTSGSSSGLSRSWGDRPRSWRSPLEAERVLLSSPHPPLCRVLLSAPPSLATLPARGLLIKSGGLRLGRSTVRAEEEQCENGEPGRGLTRKGSEVTVRSTSLSSAACAGLPWRQSEEGDVYAEPHSRWTTARRRIRDPAEIRERLAVKMEAGGSRCRK